MCDSIKWQMTPVPVCLCNSLPANCRHSHCNAIKYVFTVSNWKPKLCFRCKVIMRRFRHVCMRACIKKWNHTRTTLKVKCVQMLTCHLKKIHFDNLIYICSCIRSVHLEMELNAIYTCKWIKRICLEHHNFILFIRYNEPLNHGDE